jgi:hypothetical protein
MRGVLVENHEVQNLKLRADFHEGLAAIHEAPELRLLSGSAEGPDLVHGFRSSCRLVGLAGFHEAPELRLTTGAAVGQVLVYGFRSS